MLKIKVEGGGCAGFQYDMTFVPMATAGDIVFEAAQALVCIDPDTLPLISGSVLVFEEDMMSAAFAIKNPNAVTGCGCGNSFSLL